MFCKPGKPPSHKIEDLSCDVTLSAYPPRASLKNMPDHGGNWTYNLWNTSPIWESNLWPLEYQPMGIPEWAGIPKVVGLIPTVARHSFQACPVWIYTQSNITNIIFNWVHNINTEKSQLYDWKDQARENYEFENTEPEKMNPLKTPILKTPSLWSRASSFDIMIHLQ